MLKIFDNHPLIMQYKLIFNTKYTDKKQSILVMRTEILDRKFGRKWHQQVFNGIIFEVVGTSVADPVQFIQIRIQFRIRKKKVFNPLI